LETFERTSFLVELKVFGLSFLTDVDGKPTLGTAPFSRRGGLFSATVTIVCVYFGHGNLLRINKGGLAKITPFNDLLPT
jgi:hypothetical protein